MENCEYESHGSYFTQKDVEEPSRDQQPLRAVANLQRRGVPRARQQTAHAKSAQNKSDEQQNTDATDENEKENSDGNKERNTGKGK